MYGTDVVLGLVIMAYEGGLTYFWFRRRPNRYVFRARVLRHGGWVIIGTGVVIVGLGSTPIGGVIVGADVILMLMGLTRFEPHPTDGGF
jgi:hypothetical protein